MREAVKEPVKEAVRGGVKEAVRGPPWLSAWLSLRRHRQGPTPMIRGFDGRSRGPDGA